MKAKTWRLSPLFHFSVSFLLMLIVPLSMGLFHFGYMLDMTIQQNVYTNTLILKNSMDVLEGSLNSIRTYSSTLNQIKALDDVITASSLDSLTLLDLQKATSAFPLMRDNNQYVDTYFLYSTRNGAILAPSKMFINVNLYYGTYFNFGQLAYDEWTERILNNPQQRSGVFALPLDNGQSMLMYKAPYVSQKDDRMAGQQVYLLDNRHIHEILAPAFQIGAGFMYIEDDKGNLLVTMAQDGWAAHSLGNMGADAEGSAARAIDGKSMVVTYCKSEEYGWTYVIAVPRATLMVAAMNSLRVTLILTVFLMLAGILLILFVYRYNRSPLINLVQYIPPDSAAPAMPTRKHNRNGLWQLFSSVSSLISDKNQMELTLKQQREAIRQSFFIQLVTGQIVDEARLFENLESYGIDAQYSHIRGAYVKVISKPQMEQAQVRAIIGEAITTPRAHIRLLPCFWMDQRHLTLLCLEQEDAPVDACMELLRDIHFHLMDHFSIETIFSLGEECGGFTEVHQSFWEARNLLVSGMQASPILYVSRRDPAHRERFVYSARDEEKLLEMAGAGKFQEVQGLLGRIKRRNFDERRLNPHMREMLFYRMASTVLCAGFSAELPMSQVSLAALDTEAFFSLLLDQYALVCEQNARQLHENREKMQSEIVRYIDEHFHERDMSLSILSQRFGITESYLSTLIKSLVGENFSSYLESKRIDEANHRLRIGGMTVAEVGSAVGYESATSFGRAYKRVMGHSPSQYLKHHSRRVDGDA